jgi:hypothetical protein
MLESAITIKKESYMTSLVQKQSFNLPQGQELMMVMQLCKEVAASPFYQKLGPGGVLAIYLTAKELNIPFMFALNGGLHNVQGRVTVAATTMASMILNAGHDYTIVESNEQRCTIRFKRNDRKPPNDTYEYTFTIENAMKANYVYIDAKTGKLCGKDNWVLHTRDMLFNRCMSGGSKKFLPDIMMNVYCFGEIPGDVEIIESAPILHENEPIDQEKCENASQIDQITPEYEDFSRKLLETEHVPAYIEKVAKTSGMTKQDIIMRAMSNEEGFKSAFNKWLPGIMMQEPVDD